MTDLFRKRQAGEGRLGCLGTILVGAIFIFILSKVAPVYLAKIDFEDQVDRTLRQAGAQSYTDDVIASHVISLAELHEFDLARRDIRVKRVFPLGSAPEVRLELEFSRTVDLSLYTHVFRFQTSRSTFVGSM